MSFCLEPTNPTVDPGHLGCQAMPQPMCPPLFIPPSSETGFCEYSWFHRLTAEVCGLLTLHPPPPPAGVAYPDMIVESRMGQESRFLSQVKLFALCFDEMLRLHFSSSIIGWMKEYPLKKVPPISVMQRSVSVQLAFWRRQRPV